MYWQHDYERKGVDMTLNQTYRLDLPENGLLGSLLLTLSGDEKSGYGQMADDWRILDEISKIEIIVNGSTLVKSITGKELQALSVYDQGNMPPSVWRNYASNTQFEYLLLNFGRYLHDMDYGLDLARFKNVEIRITNTATSSDFTSLAASILCAYLRDAPSGQFKGYLRTEEWRAWTTVANETKYLDLPTEYPIRRVMFSAIPDTTTTIEDTNMSNLMYDIEFMLNSGQLRVFKGGLDVLMRLNLYELGKNLFSCGRTYQMADYGTDISLGYVYGGAAVNASADGAVSTTVATVKEGENGFMQVFEEYEGDTLHMFAFAGLAPFLTALLKFDYSDDPASWLDPNTHNVVECNIQTRNAATAADGTNAVVLDRYVSY